MHRVARWAAIGLVVLGVAACTDPDVVPETHISAVPESLAAVVADVPREANRMALFGDLHVHTSWSFDAYAGGNRLGPNTAYRFARGEKIELPTGTEAQLTQPLDFVALTDHAEGFDVGILCTIPGEPEFDSERCRLTRSGQQDQTTMLRNAFASGVKRPAQRDPDLCADEQRCIDVSRDTWQRVQALANAHNQPGTFTALIGYEFSAVMDGFGMLHRNVIFRGEEVVPHAISSQDVVNQADFFSQLDASCTGDCRVLTIPHNTNFSWGLTFSRTDEDGSEYTVADLERRARLERVFEITQQKGNSECALAVGASDEDCDFGNLFDACEEGEAQRCVVPQSMYRNAMLDGLAWGESLNFNPFKLGVIGSTDTHNSDPGNTRSDMTARLGAAQRLGFMANRMLDAEHPVIGRIRRLSGGGLAGVWAESNTRADIFDALHRRETFGTSGSRLRIRFFGGQLPANLLDSEDPVAVAYAQGVPMGADLSGVSDPRFWVWASRDVEGMPLERIQVIKGWIDEDGTPRQRVWDVACSGDRLPGDDGRCPQTQATVDLESCEAGGIEGAAELQAVFTDPDFDPGRPAFYYARVLEDPRCHWTQRLANTAGVDLPADTSPTVQDRGWSSPIWVASPDVQQASIP